MSQNILNRVKLLMEYDTSMTNTENEKKIQDAFVIEEQAWLASLKQLFTGTFDDFTKMFLKQGENFVDDAGRVITNFDELTAALQGKLLKAGAINKIRKGLLINGGTKLTPTLQSALVDDLLTKGGKNLLSKGGATKKEIAQAYVKTGYPQNVANEIAGKVLKLRKRYNITVSGTAPVTTGGGVIGNLKISEKIKRTIQEFKKTGDGWRKFKKYAIAIGIPVGIALLWWNSTTGENVQDEDAKKDTGGGGASGSGFRDCNQKDFLMKGCKSEKIKDLQTCIGFTGKDVDGIWGDDTQSRMVQLGLATGILVSDIEGICNAYNQIKTGSKADLESSREKLQNRQQNRTFSGEEPYADYDATSPSSSTPSTQPSGTNSTEGPTAEY